MPYDFNAPQANPSPAAYGPLDIGLTPHLLQMSRTIAENLRRRREDQMRQAQMQREAELHRMAMEQHGQDIASKIAQREALYTGRDETIPGGTQTVEEPVAPQMPSPETQIASGLRTDPAALQRAFGALGLGSSLPGPAAPWKTQQVERQMPDQTIHVPGLYQQRLENTAAYQNAMAGAAQQNADTRQTSDEWRRQVAENRAQDYGRSVAARAAVAGQPKGQITPAMRASKRAQILQQAMINPIGMGGLTEPDKKKLKQFAGAPRAAIDFALNDPRNSTDLQMYLRQLAPLAEE